MNSHFHASPSRFVDPVELIGSLVAGIILVCFGALATGHASAFGAFLRSVGP